MIDHSLVKAKTLRNSRIHPKFEETFEMTFPLKTTIFITNILIKPIVTISGALHLSAMMQI